MKLSIIVLFLIQTAARPEIRIPGLELHIHRSINVQRLASDREALEWDETLGNLARTHSEDMAKRGYFKHVNPEGKTPMNRLQEAGYDRCRLVGENIHQNNLYSRATTERKKTVYDWNSMEVIAATTVQAWMGSDSQRETILDGNYTRQGVGAGISLDDKVYITQIACGEK